MIIQNPLRSFVFNRPITDQISGDNPNYSKPLGYETVRYPLSGLVGPSGAIKIKTRNDQYQDYHENVRLLNQNVVAWLTSQIVVGGVTIPANMAKKHRDCLDAPNYTLFSNTSSAAEWNAALPASGGYPRGSMKPCG